MTTAGTIAGVGGRVAGGVLGGAIGSVFGPVGLWIGRAVGSRVGGMAAKAAAEALASYMEEANDDAETQTKDDEAADACVDCQPPQRRHDPCRTKGNDPTKENNTVWDPEIADQVRADIQMIREGRVPKMSGTWTVNGRTYGLHGNSLHPQSGIGLTNLSRSQHKFLKMLNQKGCKGGMEFAEYLKKNGKISQEEIDSVLDLWKKCSTS
ncbi:hypothetical protein [Afifella sp. YEN Y35]|uniref:hypothetical protein n=1 Tax=Afifella sp. YEN Y35 TaxID=3388337 RepID=UPI0039E1B802